jgi:molybdopterin-guanine dinucleotide biosynthesis protein
VVQCIAGKGGVGKSTVAVQLALAHQQAGLKVAALVHGAVKQFVDPTTQNTPYNPDGQGLVQIITPCCQSPGVHKSPVAERLMAL